MEDENIKNSQFIVGSCLLLVGILIFSFLSDPVSYFGFAFIIGAAVYFIYIFSFPINGINNERKYRSRTRDQILRHHHKTHK